MRFIHSLLFSTLTTILCAQNELPTGQIEVIKDFEVRLMETKKIRVIPQPIELDSTMRMYDYKLLAPSPSIEYLVPELKPLSINPEARPVYYPLFAKAGYGSPNSLLGEISYDHRQSEAFQWGIDFRHLSANNKKIELQKFSDSRGRIDASYHLNENVKLEGYIDGHFETDYFYGVDDIPANPDALKRNFSRWDGHFTLSNLGDEGAGLKYKILFQDLFDKDDLGNRESAVRVGGEIETGLGTNAYPIGLKVLADLSDLKNTNDQSISNLFIMPYFQWYIGDLKAHISGIVFLSDNNYETQEDESEILPAIELSYNLFNNRYTLTGGWQGEVVKNNFHYLTTYNPYMNERLDDLRNTISRKIYANFHGNSGTFQYEVAAAYNEFQNKTFFLQDEDKTEQFNPIYDDGSYVEVKGSLKYAVLKNVMLRGQLWQQFYSLDNEEKPWHVPSFGGDAQLTYSGGGDEYHVSFIAHGENGLPYRTPGGTVGNLDPLIDLNLHGDYYISNSWGAFAELNNLLGNNRERWATYPSYGFNAKAGILFRL